MRELSRTDFDLAEYLPVISEVIESGGEFRLYPRGTSMLPLIRQGVDSVVLVKKNEKCKKRDVILYRRANGQLVLHRIVKMEKNGAYTLCGDNQTYLERGIVQEDIFAVVPAFYRGEKRVQKGALSLEMYEKLWCVMPLRKIVFMARRCIAKIKRVFSANNKSSR